MNLIERLGGYEKAKEIAFDPLHPQMTHVSNDGRHWVNEEFSYIPEIQEQIPTMARIDDIRKALLKYRRKHNIYEVGDKVVLISMSDNEVFEYIEYSKGLDLHFFESEHNYGHAKLSDIRHATDAEIKAGKRL